MGKQTKCRSCGATIIWAKTESGKPMPLDARPITAFVIGQQREGVADTAGLLVVQEGEPVALSRRVHVSHFATCPDAKDWRGSSR